ncbi:tRNA-splicing endonuclease subunit Sen54 [Aplysia californica]|uniref:tRNA-splicing endonuclease subunit Sen54 n=1 Tax=Aplysia californica TaxID=6500 RepID=A0ABM0K194_APLCA|nr:tRNA-splicing endonuclease subunit Sen54 [Aplysia californica]
MAAKSFYDLTKDAALSAKSLFKYRVKRDNTVPSKGGQKNFEPDGTWMESKALEAFLQERTSVLGEPRVEKLKNLVHGVWDDSKNLVNVDKPGKFWSHMGFTDKRRNWLYPEEALFLMEINALEVSQNGIPMSIQEAYDLFLDDEMGLTEYQVFSHLRRLGYVVVRHEEQPLVTDYERQINLDKYLDKRTLKARKKKGGRPQPDKPGPSGVCDPQISSSQERLDEAEESFDKSGHSENSAAVVKDDSVESVGQSGETMANNSAKQIAEGQKRLRSESEELESGQADGVSDAKKLRSDDPDVSDVSSSKGDGDKTLSENSQGSSSPSGSVREFYSEAWLDCFKQKSRTDGTGEEIQDNKKTCLEQTSFQDNSVKFPDLAGKRVLSLVLPEKKLLPDNIHISEDTDDMLFFDVDDYRLKNPVEPLARQAQHEEDRERRLGALSFSFAEWTQRRPVVKSHSWADHRRKIADRMKELSNSTPVSHLWQGDITPLVNPCDAWSSESILEKLNIVKPADDKELKVSDDVIEHSHLSFDVHLPDSRFKKSMPGRPDHRVLVSKSRNSRPPELCQLQILSQADGVAVHWAVVDCGEIAFYVFDTKRTLGLLT